MADDGMPFTSVAAPPKVTNFQVRRPDTLQFRTLEGTLSHRRTRQLHHNAKADRPTK
jgi:hypothetical protein